MMILRQGKLGVDRLEVCPLNKRKSGEKDEWGLTKMEGRRQQAKKLLEMEMNKTMCSLGQGLWTWASEVDANELL